MLIITIVLSKLILLHFHSLQEEEQQASERERQTFTQQKNADLAKAQHQLRVKVCEFNIFGNNVSMSL